jgi:hypothetical protein
MQTITDTVVLLKVAPVILVPRQCVATVVMNILAPEHLVLAALAGLQMVIVTGLVAPADL